MPYPSVACSDGPDLASLISRLGHIVPQGNIWQMLADQYIHSMYQQIMFNPIIYQQQDRRVVGIFFASIP